MVKVYENGQSFLGENSAFLELNPYMSTFFFGDAQVLHQIDKKNFVLKAESNGKILLAIKVEPFNLLLYGDKEPTEELLAYLDETGFDYCDIMCATSIGEALGEKYRLRIGMDFMKADTFTEESCPEVIKAEEKDLEEICYDTAAFIKDCNLTDKVDKARILEKLDTFRLLKKDGRIISMAGYSPDMEGSFRITHVYTVPEERGKGHARKVVNALKNEILAMGKTATLNVDQANPISNHLYASLGFRKVFSQGIYERIR